MASEIDWLGALLESDILESGDPVREQWVLDLIALGPHGNYIEPELLRRVMDGYDDDYPDRARAEIAAFLVIYSQDVKEVMNSAAILLGMRDPVDPNIYDRRVDLRVYDPVLPPLWARSGKAIEDRISRAGWRRMSSLMDEIEPGLLEQEGIGIEDAYWSDRAEPVIKKRLIESFRRKVLREGR